MTQQRDIERLLDHWFSDGPDQAPDRVVDIVTDRIERQSQRPAWRLHWRPFPVNAYAKIAVAAAAVLIVAVVGYNLLPGRSTGVGGPAPSPTATPAPTATPTASPTPTPEPTASVVTQALTPFGADGATFTFDAPASWEQFGGLGVWIDRNAPPDGATLFIYGAAGGGLYSDPCLTKEEAAAEADVPVGPTVDDLVTALVDHQSLDVTSPVDVTLAGYSGKYLDLRVPDNISACDTYKPMDGHHYAQGPGQRWHMWVLDVGGDRALVETNDYAGTPDYRLAEERAMIDSLEINP